MNPDGGMRFKGPCRLARVSNAGVPWQIKLRARLIKPVSKTRWRALWVRYWESLGSSEDAETRQTDQPAQSTHKAAST